MWPYRRVGRIGVCYLTVLKFEVHSGSCCPKIKVAGEVLSGLLETSLPLGFLALCPDSPSIFRSAKESQLLPILRHSGSLSFACKSFLLLHWAQGTVQGLLSISGSATWKLYMCDMNCFLCPSKSAHPSTSSASSVLLGWL